MAAPVKIVFFILHQPFGKPSTNVFNMIGRARYHFVFGSTIAVNARDAPANGDIALSRRPYARLECLAKVVDTQWAIFTPQNMLRRELIGVVL